MCEIFFFFFFSGFNLLLPGRKNKNITLTTFFLFFGFSFCFFGCYYCLSFFLFRFSFLGKGGGKSLSLGLLLLWSNERLVVLELSFVESSGFGLQALNGLGWVQVLGTHGRAVHDSVAFVELEGPFGQLSHS
jgi:hypothetical protein